MRCTKSKEKAVLELRRMVSGKVNDAVKLLFIDPEELSILDGFDLSMVSEVKRAANGTVEVKFIDRLRAIELLMTESAEAEAQGQKRPAMLYDAIDRAAAAFRERSDSRDDS